MTTNANAKVIADAKRQQVEHDARSALPEYPTAVDLEQFTGTPASTWRYWAYIGSGPTSFKARPAPGVEALDRACVAEKLETSTDCAEPASDEPKDNGPFLPKQGRRESLAGRAPVYLSRRSIPDVFQRRSALA